MENRVKMYVEHWYATLLMTFVRRMAFRAHSLCMKRLLDGVGSSHIVANYFKLTVFCERLYDFAVHLNDINVSGLVLAEPFSVLTYTLTLT